MRVTRQKLYEIAQGQIDILQSGLEGGLRMPVCLSRARESLVKRKLTIPRPDFNALMSQYSQALRDSSQYPAAYEAAVKLRDKYAK